ncbi:hypothetical protein BH09PSE5_BH09PSE5_07220 [soil metagenome]
MRRLLLILLMFVLPLQFSWAAVASVCAHEVTVGAAHLGHHEHKHEHAGAGTGASVGSEASDPKAAKASTADFDTDCGTCHGVGSAAVIDPPAFHQRGVGDPFAVRYLRHSADHVPDHLLRPPLTDLA